MSKDISDREVSVMPLWMLIRVNWCHIWAYPTLTYWLGVKALGQRNKGQHFVSITARAVAHTSAVFCWQLSSWGSNMCFLRNILIFCWKVLLFINLKVTLIVWDIFFFLSFRIFSLSLAADIFQYAAVQKYKKSNSSFFAKIEVH